MSQLYVSGTAEMPFSSRLMQAFVVNGEIRAWLDRGQEAHLQVRLPDIAKDGFEVKDDYPESLEGFWVFRIDHDPEEPNTALQAPCVCVPFGKAWCLEMQDEVDGRMSIVSTRQGFVVSTASQDSVLEERGGVTTAIDPILERDASGTIAMPLRLDRRIGTLRQLLCALGDRARLHRLEATSPAQGRR